MDKLKTLHCKRKSLLKSRNKKRSLTQIKNQSLFQRLIELIDIADYKSFETMDHDRKIFLEGQRSSNRRGIINLSSQPNTESDMIIVDEISKYYK